MSNRVQRHQVDGEYGDGRRYNMLMITVPSKLIVLLSGRISPIFFFYIPSYHITVKESCHKEPKQHVYRTRILSVRMNETKVQGANAFNPNVNSPVRFIAAASWPTISMNKCTYSRQKAGNRVENARHRALSKINWFMREKKNQFSYGQSACVPHARSNFFVIFN